MKKSNILCALLIGSFACSAQVMAFIDLPDGLSKSQRQHVIQDLQRHDRRMAVATVLCAIACGEYCMYTGGPVDPREAASVLMIALGGICFITSVLFLSDSAVRRDLAKLL